MDASTFITTTFPRLTYKTGRDPSGWPTPAWSIDADQKICQDCGIETTILSVTAPGASILQGAESARLARECKEFGKALRDKSPKNCGFFAALPDTVRRFSKELGEAELSKQEEEKISRENALKLFPRLSSN